MCIQAASVFVLYATSCSNSIAGKANRKTIQGQDVVAAMEDMEFDKFIKPLETSLQGKYMYIYREWDLSIFMSIIIAAP